MITQNKPRSRKSKKWIAKKRSGGRMKTRRKTTTMSWI